MKKVSSRKNGDDLSNNGGDDSSIESDDEVLVPPKKGSASSGNQSKTPISDASDIEEEAVTTAVAEENGTSEKKSRGRKRKGAKKGKKVEVEESAQEEEYEVQSLVDHKVEKGVSYFLIRWKGYGSSDDTWEREDSLSCPDLIEKFNKKEGDKKPAKGKGPPKKRAKMEEAEDEEKEWEVERIIEVAEDKKHGRIFRIRWKGYRANQDTWEPEDNLNCKDLIDKFLKKHESIKSLGSKSLREEPKRTKRFVNEAEQHRARGARTSKRNSGKKSKTYYDDEED